MTFKNFLNRDVDKLNLAIEVQCRKVTISGLLNVNIKVNRYKQGLYRLFPPIVWGSLMSIGHLEHRIDLCKSRSGYVKRNLQTARKHA